MKVYILVREINDSITKNICVYKNREQAEQGVILNKKNDEINFKSSKVIYKIECFEPL